MADVTTIPEALAAVGRPGAAPSRQPLLRGADGTLVTVATLTTEGVPVWHGVWIDAGGARALGEAVPPSLLPERTSLASATATLVDLLRAAERSYIEWLERLGDRLDALEVRPDPAPLPELGALLHALAGARKQTVRLELIVAELDGPLGQQFPGIGAYLPEFRLSVSHLGGLASGLAQGVRDLVAIRNAVEANRLAATANHLGEVSNGIAALANNSNLRMLGVAYIALVLALVSAVVLIPNTAATILGMPSAGWVPGLWVDVILVVLAIVPLAVVFSRPWVLRTLRGLGGFEHRTSEGLTGLPEVSPRQIENDPAIQPGAR